MLSNPFVRAIVLAAGLVLWPALAAGSDELDDLARALIGRFYDALAPDSTVLAEFLGAGFQIIGSDGLRFDRETYLTFPKAVTRYEISDLIARRDGNVLTATFEIGYKGEFQGAARTVPRLARLAVFSETEHGWKLQALAALGTGENDVTGEATEVVTRWLAANASGDAAAVRQLASPDFQLQRPDGNGVALEGFLKDVRVSRRPPAVDDLVATSFSNTMITRYSLGFEGKTAPRMTVFQRINGEWRAAADAEYRPIE